MVSFYTKSFQPPENIFILCRAIEAHRSKEQKIFESRNSLFVDSTGGIVGKFDKLLKRVVLYSIVMHIRQESKRGPLIPGAEALTCRHYEEHIKRFFMDLKIFCVTHTYLMGYLQKNCCTLERGIN